MADDVLYASVNFSQKNRQPRKQEEQATEDTKDQRGEVIYAEVKAANSLETQKEEMEAESGLRDKEGTYTEPMLQMPMETRTVLENMNALGPIWKKLQMPMETRTALEKYERLGADLEEGTYQPIKGEVESDPYSSLKWERAKNDVPAKEGASEHPSNSKMKACLLKFLLFLCGSLLASIVLLAIYNLNPSKDKGAVDEMRQNYSIAEQQLIQLRMQYDSLNREHSNLSEYQKTLQMNLTSLQSLYSNLSANHTKLLSHYSALTQENADFFAEFEKLNKRCPILNPSSQSRTCYVCPQNWLFFNSKCYLFSSDKLTWRGGHDGCKAEGAHLVIIESEEEQTFLLNELSKQRLKKPYWIGLNDYVTEGQFVWVDNKRLDPSKSFWGVNWDGSMEPDNWGNQEDCVQIQTGGWYDAACSQKNNVICERAAEGIAL